MTTSGVPDRTAPATTARTVAQAKINLFLRVLAREASGYHQLETLFCRLELGDDVVVRTDVRNRSLDASGDVIPPAGLGPVDRNLAWRAAEAFAKATGWPNAWAIEIRKRIPVGGGLGGGSADAGAVLRCLNAISPAPLPTHALLALAASLGADVPFLSMDEPVALGWGRGERLLPVPVLPARAVVLACFPFGVSTPDAYRWLDDARDSFSPEAAVLELDRLGSWARIAQLAHNDFEAVVAPRFAAIATTLNEWRSHIDRIGDPEGIALLAGSGATVFLLSDRVASALHDAREPSPRIVRTSTATRVVAVEVSD
jgi:4-diphosphocytidyl-2-C-methyl-D-erythritol kinase